MTKPVFIIQNVSRSDLWKSQGTSLRDALKRHDRVVEHMEIPSELMQPKMYLRIAEFLNEHVYDYAVQVGEAKEVK